MVISGNTSGSILSDVFKIAGWVKSYSLVNKTAGTITVSVAVVTAGGQVFTDSVSLAANAAQKTDVGFEIQAGSELLITAGGSLDYYFTIE